MAEQHRLLTNESGAMGVPAEKMGKDPEGGVPVQKIRGLYRRIKRAVVAAVQAFGRAWAAGEEPSPGHAIRWPVSGTWTHCSGAVEARNLFLGAKANGEPVERWQDGVRKDWWPR